MQYSGFGGLKFALNPIAEDIDINNNITKIYAKVISKELDKASEQYNN